MRCRSLRLPCDQNDSQAAPFFGGDLQSATLKQIGAAPEFDHDGRGTPGPQSLLCGPEYFGSSHPFDENKTRRIEKLLQTHRRNRSDIAATTDPEYRAFGAGGGEHGKHIACLTHRFVNTAERQAYPVCQGKVLVPHDGPLTFPRDNIHILFLSFRESISSPENTSLKGVLPKNHARPALDKTTLGELIDSRNPDANDWLVTQQFTIIEHRKDRRPDVVAFVNGLPFGALEPHQIPNGEYIGDNKTGPVAELCRFFDHVSCRKGAKTWHHDIHRNFGLKRFG